MIRNYVVKQIKSTKRKKLSQEIGKSLAYLKIERR